MIPYLTDTNGTRLTDGCRVFIYAADGITPVYGTLKLSEPPADYKFSVKWDDMEQELYWTGLQSLWLASEGVGEGAQRDVNGNYI